MRPPDYDGKAKAWILPILAESPHLACWLVEAPWAHPFWSHYLISLVHLRDLPRLANAKKSYPEAAYELAVLALDPGPPNGSEVGSKVDPDDTKSCIAAVMRGSDIAVQFHGVLDPGAVDIATTLVLRVVAGMLSPDVDHRATWLAHVIAGAEHFAGIHGTTH